MWYSLTANLTNKKPTLHVGEIAVSDLIRTRRVYPLREARKEEKPYVYEYPGSQPNPYQSTGTHS
ncbi:hypothetical protein BOTCAL_0021g00410 [Botryotinia calthae]|uniref:Uncharacterized protein n=1 Tax=Botryotinia calthae TaxID=38488 RepID=A0A4Y8DF41_9HELO|nr:hypothetical protein BOTCAL_0021g00410 [Botryotinia calthae]